MDECKSVDENKIISNTKYEHYLNTKILKITLKYIILLLLLLAENDIYQKEIDEFKKKKETRQKNIKKCERR